MEEKKGVMENWWGEGLTVSERNPRKADGGGLRKKREY